MDNFAIKTAEEYSGHIPNESTWAERADHWANNQPTARRLPIQRRKLRAPLVLSGYGVHLRVNHGALEVRNGFTHYPQKQDEYRFFPGDQQRPSRIIVLEGGGVITFDVLTWLSEQDIPLIQLDYRGRVVTVVGGAGRVADPQLTRAQLAASADPNRKLAIASWFISEKLVRSAAVLEQHVPSSDRRDVAIEHLIREAKMLTHRPAKALDPLLGIEGRAAALYFQCWHDMPINWKDLNRRPIPADWNRVGPRSSARKRNSNRSTSHPVQAVLNYGYAVLEGQARIEAAKAGLDPMIGFLHQFRQERPERPGLILDLLEPMRPEVDRQLLRLVREESFAPADFTLTRGGTCRLHPQLARRMVSLVSEVEGLPVVLARLVEMLDHQPQRRPPHRSKA